ncbi:GlsB/YeaQ/YmgE family stress response membrane protein [Acidobacteria bacterium ACD]|nr:MAG: GlsB/YeaQ/YmgE family stress response membrane protein [Acidobacteriota bacterium]MCE7958054.1 GlsB/YeaQ/YmgE family stress response membrane protein [Acidobacteria bacterium ACB2]MDL1950058.1 GlsB/YeaQ/YmgE family stress response membrane protein [Acidobacteria bacterium ACD]
MGCLTALWYVVTGFVVGLLARALLPGSDEMGFVLTTLLGIVGSVVGGFLGGLLGKPAEGKRPSRAGFLMSLVGAILVLVLYRLVF